MTILNRDTPTIRAVNPRAWIKGTDYLEQSFRTSLRALTVQRGETAERTLQHYAQWMATHEQRHLKQIAHIASTIPKSL